MGDRPFPQDVTIGQIRLDQRDFLHTRGSLFIRVKRPSESFQSRHNVFPRIPREVVLGGVVRGDHELHQDIYANIVLSSAKLDHIGSERFSLTSLVPESEIAQGRLGVFPRGALRDLKSAGDFDKLRGRSFRQTQFEFDILVRCGLQGAQAPGHALPQHHPIFDIGIRRLGPCREFNHRVGFMRQTQAERVDRNPGTERERSACTMRRGDHARTGGRTWQLRPGTPRNPRSPRLTSTNR